jgi:DNA (cytosine-5)-methyltransferase 1
VSRPPAFSFYEFFAGGGMARVGLGPGWTCLIANDIDPAKAGAYAANFGSGELRLGDVWDLQARELPGRADLAWASSPCQDVSLAGAREGLSGRRSSAFWGFWRLIGQLEAEGRAPRAIGIENVTGLLSSHGGADFAAICAALAGGGYRFGAMEIDAALFTPQSRPRMFLIAMKDPPPGLLAEHPGPFQPAAVRQAFERLAPELKAGWLWWRLPPPASRNPVLADLLESDAETAWLDPARTRALVALMAPLHRARLEEALAAGERRIGTAFRRTRIEDGQRVQRAEIRFDGAAGCLRTPAGGSSRQFVLVAERGELKARLLSPREAARLMGLPDEYRLPASATAALHVAGDGVVASVVRHIAAHLLEPALAPERAAA